MNNNVPLPAIEMMVKQYIMCQKHVSDGEYMEALPYVWGLFGLLRKYHKYIIDEELKKVMPELFNMFVKNGKKIIYVETNYWEVQNENPSLYYEIVELYSSFLHYSMMALIDLGAYEHEGTSKLFNLTELLNSSSHDGIDEDDEDDDLNDGVQYINKGGRGWSI